MIKLRKFSLSNLDQVARIEKISFPKKEIFSNFLFEKYCKEYPEGFIVAERKKEIVGYTIGRPKDKGAEIISLAVDPLWRQKGIGTKLTDFLINHFKSKGIGEISLYVRTENKNSISFYQNLGFKILETIKNYYRNGDNAFLMKREI